ncbi:MAG TPA: RodZ domain-containing protein, partial [Methyloradius sp.]
EPMPEPALPVAERDAAAEAIAPAINVPSETNPTDNPLPASAPAATPEKPIDTAVTGSNPQVKPVGQPLSSPAPVINNVPVPQISSQSQTVSPSAPAKSLLNIRFTFSEPTWVSVLDADNKEVLNKTGQPGSQEKIEVAPPAKLVIGNANGTHLEVNNKAVDLTPYNKLNVVRLTLE